jgi:hypothetical protein
LRLQRAIEKWLHKIATVSYHGTTVNAETPKSNESDAASSPPPSSAGHGSRLRRTLLTADGLDGTDNQLTTDQRRALEGKRPLSKSYIARHWRGELSLPRSYWINAVLLNIAFRFAITLLAEIGMAVLHTNVWAGLAVTVAAYALMMLWLVVGIWQLVGLWRSATYYVGWPVWAGIVKLQVILGWLAYLILIATIASKFLPK